VRNRIFYAKLVFDKIDFVIRYCNSKTNTCKYLTFSPNVYSTNTIFCISIIDTLHNFQYILTVSELFNIYKHFTFPNRIFFKC